MSDDLPEGPFRELRRIDMHPDDLSVLNMSQLPSTDEIEVLYEQWRPVAGNRRLLVLGPDTELTAYRPVEQAEEPPAEGPTAPLSWHYGPTDWDPDPGKMWHTNCPAGRGQVLAFEEGAICSDCGADDTAKEQR